MIITLVENESKNKSSGSHTKLVYDTIAKQSQQKLNTLLTLYAIDTENSICFKKKIYYTVYFNWI